MSNDLRVPAERDFRAGRLQRRKEHLVNELTFAPTRRRRRLVLGALVPAAVLLLAATGVTTYVLTRPATQLESVGCYDRLDLQANTTIVSADGRDPVAICAELWRAGAVGPGPAPELTACVLPSGAVGVFPSVGAKTCNSLGLAGLSPDYAADVEVLSDLRASLVPRFATDCLGESEGRRLVERELASRGLTDWAVEVAGDGFDPKRPCAELGTDSGRRIALLLAVEQVQIACYERPELPTDFVLARANGTDPIELCRGVWEQGRLRGDAPAIACLLHGSSVGVFPAGAPGLCGRLGPSVSPLREG
jgi:hypothetical protein